MKEIAILGSTGSIGTQTLDIVRIYPRLFHVSVISAKRNIDALFAQAEEYGHSVTREFCFLVAHSMLHLLGYDHMTEDEAKVMEAKQAAALKELGINR